MIKFENYDILYSNMSTLKETSIDNRNKGYTAYMTVSDRAAVNFDDVKREYIRTLNLSEEPKSNDALFLTDKNELVFVEFKNGFMDSAKKYAVRKKVYDSIIILTDILNLGIGSLRDKMQYILVYNETVNKEETDVKKKNSHVQSSDAFDSFAKNVSRLAQKEYICFGVRIFENYCFKKVHTYTEKEFEQFLKEN